MLLGNSSADAESTDQKSEDVVEVLDRLAPEDDPDVKKCWICFSNETEDTPETSPWRDPCPCALVAHEQCLLDWIADTEAPKNIGRGGALSGPQILCPQCKTEIRLARPRNYIVDIVRAFDRLSARVVMPGGIVLLSTDVLYKISFSHGVHSIYRIFGTADADRILAPVMRHWARPPIDFDLSLSDIRTQAVSSVAHYAQHWRLYFGLPLVTPIVLLSRTNWHFSEAILTILPTVFFALQPSTKDELFEFGVWPPSASMAFALLPYARQAYNLYYERVWAAKERAWKREILPPTSQTQPEANANQDPAQRIEDAVEDADVFEIRVDGGIWEDWEEPVAAPPANPAADVDARGADAGQEDPANIAQAAAGPAPAPNVPDNRAARPAHAAPNQRAVERRLAFSPAAVAENVLGALAFPTIAELSGELLKLALPKSWTSVPAAALSAVGAKAAARSGAKGLLQEKWGRSLVGGCLFVIFKDAVMLYVRWQMAQMHRNRRILEYDRSKSRPRS